MKLDPSSVGTAAEPYRATWSGSDAILYALSVGAGTGELAYTTENTSGVAQQVLPTFGLVIGQGPNAKLPSLVGQLPAARAVHAEQSFTLHRPLPVEGDVTMQRSVGPMYDKGADGIVALDTVATDTRDGAPIFTRRTSVFVRGAGGWGGERGPDSAANEPPARLPDHLVNYLTSPDQALLYRLTGDRARLHSDPAAAAEAGFERPILHGLCTLGFASRALLHTLCGGATERFLHIEARFSRPVLPGDELEIRIWQTEPGSAIFGVTVGDEPVLCRGAFRYAP